MGIMSEFCLPNPQNHCIMSLLESEKSWYLLTILLRIGHPACPEELASKCKIFPVSPDFIQCVCSVVDSPLYLMKNGLVAVSMAAISHFSKFLPKSVVGDYILRYVNWDSGPKSLWDDSSRAYVRKRKSAVLDMVEMSMAKRRLILSSGNGERYQRQLSVANGIQEISFEENLDTPIKPKLTAPKSENTHEDKSMCSLHLASISKLLSISEPQFEYKEADTGGRISIIGHEEISKSLHASKPGDDEKMNQLIHFEDGNDERHDCKFSLISANENAGVPASSSAKEGYSHSTKREKANVGLSAMSALIGELTNDLHRNNKENNIKQACLTINIENQSNLLPGNCSHRKQMVKSSKKLIASHTNTPHPELQVLVESCKCKKIKNVAKNVDKCKSVQRFFSVEQKPEQNCNSSLRAEEKLVETTSRSPQLDKKRFPSLVAFIIEDKEGSGGYGTVYRVRRKNDEKRLAIKCPHDNAQKHHINNELNMLERFGGRNFIIKFEGSFKNGNNECLILEHVEHDRPEVLKNEINIFQLQWYGYCMFMALAYLHKQGVVHRDVKPGNFLFSQKSKKGYLIDFNLAMDLQQRHGFGSKSKPTLKTSFDNTPLPGSALSIKDKNLARNKSATAYNEDKKCMKKEAHAPRKHCPQKVDGNLVGSQGPDGSVITSTKDVTSTMVPSTEKRREPLPCHGRKDLISFLQDSMPFPDRGSSKGPASQRKRVAAPSGKLDSKMVFLTPMPVQKSAVPLGLLGSKENGKQRKEGLCVGTKGFRAPEVLFRSLHQGPKMDVWSAGVTLLFLMIGRTPFTGEPEQNLKDIARLRGSEDLWEVAKLHSRESSFPAELYNPQYLPSMDLQSWCKVHTRRPEFLEHIPKSLFDLVDKCLTVNPRPRISAEEALKHEFFASCHDSLRKQSLIRRGVSLGAAGAQGGNFVN